jgi:hypothetical protein
MVSGNRIFGDTVYDEYDTAFASNRPDKYVRIESPLAPFADVVKEAKISNNDEWTYIKGNREINTVVVRSNNPTPNATSTEEGSERYIIDVIASLTNLDSLEMGLGFDITAENLKLPQSLRSLTLAYCMDQPIERIKLPNLLHSFRLGAQFNKPVEKLALPNSLCVFDLGDTFNQPIEKLILPQSLNALRFGAYFNQPVEKLALPSSLETLEFGYSFNMPIEKLVLPSYALKTLRFGTMFDQPVSKLVLPQCLLHLIFSISFIHSIEKLALPPNLQTLRFGQYYNMPIDRLRLPLTLISFKIGIVSYSFKTLNEFKTIIDLPKSALTLTLTNTVAPVFEKSSMPSNANAAAASAGL